MTATKMTAEISENLLIHERHTLHKLRTEERTTRNPDRLHEYICFTRLSIICAKHGYMLNA